MDIYHNQNVYKNKEIKAFFSYFTVVLRTYFNRAYEASDALTCVSAPLQP